MAAKGYIERMLGENESIRLIARQHWFVIISSIFAEVVGILFLIILGGIASVLMPGDISIPRWLPALLVALIILIPIFTLTYDILGWWNRQYLVTSRRVIQISGLFNKNVIDSSLEKVNDVKLSQSVFGRIFDYGDVEILTASELGVNLFRRIEDPIQFKTAMLNAKEHLERGSQGGSDQSLPALIAQLDNLRQQGVLTDAEFQAKKAELLSRM